MNFWIININSYHRKLGNNEKTRNQREVYLATRGPGVRHSASLCRMASFVREIGGRLILYEHQSLEVGPARDIHFRSIPKTFQILIHVNGIIRSVEFFKSESGCFPNLGFFRDFHRIYSALTASTTIRPLEHNHNRLFVLSGLLFNKIYRTFGNFHMKIPQQYYKLIMHF